MVGGELWSSSGRRILAALAVIAALALAVSTAARGSVVRDAVAAAASCGTDEFDGTMLDDVRWDVLRPGHGGPRRRRRQAEPRPPRRRPHQRHGDRRERRPPGSARRRLDRDHQAQRRGHRRAGRAGRHRALAPGGRGPERLRQADVQPDQRRGREGRRGDLDRAQRPGRADREQPERARSRTSPTCCCACATTARAWSASTRPTMAPTGPRPARTPATPAPCASASWRSRARAATPASCPSSASRSSARRRSTAAAPSGPAPFEATFTSTVDGTWNFGDGTPAGTGTSVAHTFTEPGVYRVRQTAGGVTGSTVVTVTPAQAPALPQSDEFSGNELDPKWEVLRQRHTGIRMSGGSLRLQQYAGDMHGGTANAFNVLLQNAPQGCAYTATTRIDVQELTATGDQVGMVLWRSETPYLNFSKVVYNRRSATTWWVERSNTVAGAAQGTTNTAITGVPTHIYLRLNVSADGLVQPERSTDGTTWTAVGGAYSVASHEQLKIGLAFFGANSFRQAGYDYFRVESQGPCEPPPPCPAATAEAGFTPIWDGRTVDGWRQAGPGTFAIVNDGGTEGCRLDSRGGLGLLWYELAQYDEFVLRLQFKTQDDTDNSGVFVRFPNPQADANIPINQGHEIQIREGVDGDGENQKTGSVYNFDREDARNARPVGEWNDYEIRFEDGTYTITLNGTVVNTFTPTGTQVRNPGHIGIQNHGDGDRVSFRNIRVQQLGDAVPAEPLHHDRHHGVRQPRQERDPRAVLVPRPGDAAVRHPRPRPGGHVRRGPGADARDVRHRAQHGRLPRADAAAAAGRPAGLLEDPLLRDDRRRQRRRRLPAALLRRIAADRARRVRRLVRAHEHARPPRRHRAAEPAPSAVAAEQRRRPLRDLPRAGRRDARQDADLGHVPARHHQRHRRQPGGLPDGPHARGAERRLPLARPLGPGPVRRRPDLAGVPAPGQPGRPGWRRRLVPGARRGHAERGGRDRRLGSPADPVPGQRRRVAGLRRNSDPDQRRRPRAVRVPRDRRGRQRRGLQAPCRSRSTARRPRPP